MGAASKGIIQRDHQHNAVMYRQYYSANPFENMTEAEMEQYQAEVQRKEKGESGRTNFYTLHFILLNHIVDNP